MNVLTELRRRFLPSRFNENGAKALTQMSHDGASSAFTILLPTTDIDFENKVGDGLGSSVLMAPLNWLMRTFPEAPPIVERLEQEVA